MGVSGVRAQKNRAWRAIVILYGVHGHPFLYAPDNLYQEMKKSRAEVEVVSRGGGGEEWRR
jgi:hypothetical protein